MKIHMAAATPCSEKHTQTQGSGNAILRDADTDIDIDTRVTPRSKALQT